MTSANGRSSLSIGNVAHVETSQAQETGGKLWIVDTRNSENYSSIVKVRGSFNSFALFGLWNCSFWWNTPHFQQSWWSYATIQEFNKPWKDRNGREGMRLITIVGIDKLPEKWSAWYYSRGRASQASSLDSFVPQFIAELWTLLPSMSLQDEPHIFRTENALEPFKFENSILSRSKIQMLEEERLLQSWKKHRKDCRAFCFSKFATFHKSSIK